MPTNEIDYTRCVTVPVRDFHKPDAPVAFLVDVYGVSRSDLTAIGGPIGSRPVRHAIERLGLDPNRFQATLFDL